MIIRLILNTLAKCSSFCYGLFKFPPHLGQLLLQSKVNVQLTSPKCL